MQGTQWDTDGQSSTYAHKVGMMRLGWKEVNHPSMGSGWHAQICTGLSTKGVVRELYEGSHGLQQGMAVNECTIQHVSWILVEYTLSEC